MFLPFSPILKNNPQPFGYFKPILSVMTDIKWRAVVDDSTSNDLKGIGERRTTLKTAHICAH